MPEKYVEVFFDAPADEYELASHYLLESGCLGIEDFEEEAGRQRGRAFFPGSGQEEAKAVAIKALAVAPNCRCLSAESKEALNWFAERKIHFPPIHAAEGIVVLPEWEEEIPDAVNIRIRPGMAFGTGNHETTQIALRLLAEATRQSGAQSFVEVGVGSGVLSIAAVKLGHRYVGSCDIQPECREEVETNFKLSGLSESPAVCIGGPSLLTVPAGLVIANMTVNELMPLEQEFLRLSQPGGRFIFCGVDSAHLERFKSAFSANFDFLAELSQNDWHGFLAERKG